MQPSSSLRRRPRPTQVLSAAFGPAPLLTFALVQAGAETGAHGIWTALLGSLPIAVLPYSALLPLIRPGRVSGRFTTGRLQRSPILACALVSAVLGACTLAWLGAGARLLAVGIASIIALLVVTAVNLAWTPSIHAAIAAFVGILQFAYLPPTVTATLHLVPASTGVVAAALLLMPAAVGWARIREGAHTPLQVLAGYGSGTAAALCYLPVLTLVRSSFETTT